MRGSSPRASGETAAAEAWRIVSKGPDVPAALIFFALFSLEVVVRFKSSHLSSHISSKTSDMAAERLRSFAAQMLPAGQKTGIDAMSVLPR
jgi:hypothetical protein